MEGYLGYDESLALKELGFTEPTLYAFDAVPMRCSHAKTVFDFKNYNAPSGGHYVSQPTYEQAFKWFKSKHGFKFHIWEDKWNHWCTPKILIPETNDYEELCDSHDSYSEAELACLKQLIKMVKF